MVKPLLLSLAILGLGLASAPADAQRARGAAREHVDPGRFGGRVAGPPPALRRAPPGHRRGDRFRRCANDADGVLGALAGGLAGRSAARVNSPRRCR